MSPIKTSTEVAGHAKAKVIYILACMMHHPDWKLIYSNISRERHTPNSLAGNQEAQPTFSVGPSKIRDRDKIPKILSARLESRRLWWREIPRIGAIRTRFRSESAKDLSDRD